MTEETKNKAINITEEIKKKLIEDILLRMDTMIDVCSKIRTLSGSFALISHLDKIFITLNSLTASWDCNRMPLMSNGKMASYLDPNEKIIFLDDFSAVDLQQLSDADLMKIYNYFQMMITIKQ